MHVKRLSDNKNQADPEWVNDLVIFINKNHFKKITDELKKVFIELYFENLRNGMKPNDALEKAKATISCFLLLYM
jgi:hypothetical protein